MWGSTNEIFPIKFAPHFPTFFRRLVPLYTLKAIYILKTIYASRNCWRRREKDADGDNPRVGHVQGGGAYGRVVADHAVEGHQRWRCGVPEDRPSGQDKPGKPRGVHEASGRAFGHRHELASGICMDNKVGERDMTVGNVGNLQDRTNGHTGGLSGRPEDAVLECQGHPPLAGKLLPEVEPERVEWLWPGRLPLGKLAVLDGDPGLGKSALTLDVAARVSAGLELPDGGRCGPAGVVLLSAEDGLADTIKPRLDAAGADTERIVALSTVAEGRTGERAITITKDLPIVEQAIGRVGAA